VPGVVTSAVLDCVFDVSAYSFVELSFFLHWAVGYHPNCRAELDFFIRLDSGPWGSLGPICPGAPTVTPPWQRISLGILTHGARTLEIGYNATVLLNPTTELTAFVAIDDLVVTGLHP
jgi:hypothetical protein